MAGDGLFDPLGMDRAEPARPRLSAPMVVATVALAAAAALIALAWLRDDGDRGTPLAVSPIGRITAPPAAPEIQGPATQAPAAPAAAPPTLPKPDGDQDVEIQNGVRIIRPRRDRTPAESPGPQAPTPPAGAPSSSR